ncbi:MAG: hypothetical protein AAF363_09365 [Bacteroidota bacterium]
MNFELTPDLLERQVARRFNQFDQPNECLGKFEITKDLYIDLLCAFNDPDSFKASTFLDYPLPSILLYLKRTHELYKTRSLQEIMMAIERLNRADHTIAQTQSFLLSFFTKFKSDLESHIKEEEVKLFPYIESLMVSQENQIANFSVEKTALQDFLCHHDDHLEADLFNLVKILEALSEKHTDSFDFRMLVNKLSVFELDLRIHGKIEEEVLITKAIALEKKALSRNIP